MEQSSRDSNRSAGQDNTRVLWNTKVHTKCKVEMEEYWIEVRGRLHAPAVLPLEEGAQI